MSMLGQIAKYYYGYNYLKGFVPLFYLRDEANIPTMFSFLQLLWSSILLFIIASEKRNDRDRYAIQWKILAFVFMYVSID